VRRVLPAAGGVLQYREIMDASAPFKNGGALPTRLRTPSRWTAGGNLP